MWLTKLGDVIHVKVYRGFTGQLHRCFPVTWTFFYDDRQSKNESVQTCSVVWFGLLYSKSLYIWMSVSGRMSLPLPTSSTSDIDFMKCARGRDRIEQTKWWSNHLFWGNISPSHSIGMWWVHRLVSMRQAVIVAGRWPLFQSLSDLSRVMLLEIFTSAEKELPRCNWWCRMLLPPDMLWFASLQLQETPLLL